MKTPFTPSFHLANIPLTRVSRRPFVPSYHLPFVDSACTAYHVGGTCQLIYRWHDAFDVFVAVLEAVVLQPLEIPIASHLFDLHLVYQLCGESVIVPETTKQVAPPPVLLPESHRMEVYTPPARAVLQLRPDAKTKRYALATVVPKGDWVTRHPTKGESPMEVLIQHLRRRYAEHRYLHPTPISPDMNAWLHLLLTTPNHSGMALDDALNGPMVKLVEAHRATYLRIGQEDQDYRMAEAARVMVTKLVDRLDGHQTITVAEVSLALRVHPKQLWKAHYAIYDTSLAHYINEQLMERAKAWLAEGKTVKEVGLALGYSTPSNFSRSFKKKYGISPDEYRNRT